LNAYDDGGTLVEEFQAAKCTTKEGQRLIDTVIILGGEKKVHWKDIDIAGKDINQRNPERMGMYLMRQAYFSPKLMEAFNPRSIKAVALRTVDNEVLDSLFEKEAVEAVNQGG